MSETGRTHHSIIGYIPLPAGWRVLMSNEYPVPKTVDPEPHPIAALADVLEWECDCSIKLGHCACRRPALDYERARRILFPVWARGISYVGDSLEMETHEESILMILGPEEECTPEMLKDLQERLKPLKKETPGP